MVACTLERNWLTYIVASFTTLFGGVVVLFLIEKIHKRLHISKTRGSVVYIMTVLNRLQGIAEAILYGNTPGSKATVSMLLWRMTTVV